MNMEKIENYMEKHNFLEADKKKVRDCIKLHNAIHEGADQAYDGYLTRNSLCLKYRQGIAEYSRIQLGIQENFK